MLFDFNKFCSYLLHHPSHLFPLLCWVDVSDKLPPHSPVMCLLTRQSLLPHVHPPPLRSSFPFISTLITLFPPCSPSIFITCSCYFTFCSALSCIFLIFLLILSFLILSIFVTPHFHLNILISATSNIFCCASYS